MSPKVAEKVFQPFFTTKPTEKAPGLASRFHMTSLPKGMVEN
jgi:hypothetical protein